MSHLFSIVVQDASDRVSIRITARRDRDECAHQDVKEDLRKIKKSNLEIKLRKISINIKKNPNA